MAKINKKQHVDKTTRELTLERFDYLYDRFDTVSVSFSGGKDSTAVLNCAIEVATEKRRLPVHVFTFDEEAIPPETVEYMERVRQRDDVNFRWFCVPIQHRNACSNKQPYWYCWAPEDKKIWCRDLPKNAITEIPGGKRGGIPDYINWLFTERSGTVANCMGIRTQESMTRYGHIATKKGDRAFIMPGKSPVKHIQNCYPIYDWTTEDVWLAPDRLGWDYNHAYDVMSKAGVALSLQRCSPPFGEQPIRRLWTYKQCWPELWAKMTQRVHGAATAARYANTELYACGVSNNDLPEGMTWRELTMNALSKLTPESRQEAASAIATCINMHKKRSNNRLMPDDEPDPLSGFCWKTLYIAAKVGGNKFGRQSQKMTNKALQERKRRGITK